MNICYFYSMYINVYIHFNCNNFFFNYFYIYLFYFILFLKNNMIKKINLLKLYKIITILLN